MKCPLLRMIHHSVCHLIKLFTQNGKHISVRVTWFEFTFMCIHHIWQSPSHISCLLLPLPLPLPLPPFQIYIHIIGPQWTGNSPYSPSVTAYISNESATGEGEGEMAVLNMVAKSLHVPVNWWWFPFRDIVGVQYCQTISYEYALSNLIKEVVPPFCTSSPPTYKHYFSKEKKWDCPMSTTPTTTGTEL